MCHEGYYQNLMQKELQIGPKDQKMCSSYHNMPNRYQIKQVDQKMLQTTCMQERLQKGW